MLIRKRQRNTRSFCGSGLNSMTRGLNRLDCYTRLGMWEQALEELRYLEGTPRYSDEQRASPRPHSQP